MQQRFLRMFLTMVFLIMILGVTWMNECDHYTQVVLISKSYQHWLGSITLRLNMVRSIHFQRVVESV